MPSDQLEVEWQYAALDTRPVVRWLSGPMPAGFHVTRRGEKHLDDAYFDTADWRINLAGYTCRIRDKGGSAELTLKAKAAADGGMRSRREINEELDGAGADPVSATGPCGSIIRAVAGRRPVSKIFSLQTYRQVWDLSDEAGVLAEIAIDETSIPVGEDRPVRLSRVEVEVQPDAIARAKPFVAAMVAANRLAEAPTSKFESALIATGQQPPELSHQYGPAAPGPDMTAGEVAFAVLRKQFAALRMNEPGTRLGEDIEALHDMRVASRRLRAAMAAFRPYLTPRILRYREQFEWVGNALGQVRDLDVQLERLPAWRQEAGPERSLALDAVERMLVTRRSLARKRMLAVLDSRRYEALCASFATALRAGPPKSFAPGRVPILAVAPELIERRYRRVRKLGDAIRRDSPPDAYHSLRIDAKKLRYALEFVGAGIYGRPAVEFSQRVTEMQDVLGLHQDAYVAIDLLQELADTSGRKLGATTLMLMGSISERCEREAAALRGRFPAVYKSIGGPEWRRLLKILEEQKPPADEGGVLQLAPVGSVRSAAQSPPRKGGTR